MSSPNLVLSYTSGYAPPQTIPILVIDSSGYGSSLAYISFYMYYDNTFSLQTISSHDLQLVSTTSGIYRYIAYLNVGDVVAFDESYVMAQCNFASSVYVPQTGDMSNAISLYNPPAQPTILGAYLNDSNLYVVANPESNPDLGGYNVVASVVSSTGGSPTFYTFLNQEFVQIVIDDTAVPPTYGNEIGATGSPMVLTLNPGDLVYVSIQEETTQGAKGAVSNTVEANGTGAPNAPSSVAISGNNSALSVTIDWSAPVPGIPAGSYNIYRSTNGVDWTLIQNVSAAEPFTYTDSDLSIDETYYYEVTAVGLSGAESSPTSSIPSSWYFSLPNPVQNLAVELLSSSVVNDLPALVITYTAPSNAGSGSGDAVIDHYGVQIDSGPIANNGLNLSFTTDQLSTNTTHYVTVYAYGVSGDPSSANYNDGDGYFVGIASTPTNGAIALVPYVDNTVGYYLTWEVPDSQNTIPATSFNVWLNESDSVNILATAPLNYLWSGLDVNGSYSFQIRSVTWDGVVNNVNYINFDRTVPQVDIVASYNYSISYPSNKAQVTINWTQPSNGATDTNPSTNHDPTNSKAYVSGYNVSIWLNDTTEVFNQDYDNDVFSDTTNLANGLSAGLYTYNITVNGLPNTNTGLSYIQDTFTINGPSAPTLSTVYNVIAAYASTGAPDNGDPTSADTPVPVVSWTAPSDLSVPVASYNIYVDDDGDSTLVMNVNSSTLEAVVYDVSNWNWYQIGYSYYSIFITSVDYSGDESEPSNSVAVQFAYPDAPNSVSPSYELVSGGINLYWGQPDNSVLTTGNSIADGNSNTSVAYLEQYWVDLYINDIYQEPSYSFTNSSTSGNISVNFEVGIEYRFEVYTQGLQYNYSDYMPNPAVITFEEPASSPTNFVPFAGYQRIGVSFQNPDSMGGGDITGAYFAVEVYNGATLATSSNITYDPSYTYGSGNYYNAYFTGLDTYVEYTVVAYAVTVVFGVSTDGNSASANVTTSAPPIFDSLTVSGSTVSGYVWDNLAYSGSQAAHPSEARNILSMYVVPAINPSAPPSSTLTPVQQITTFSFQAYDNVKGNLYQFSIGIVDTAVPPNAYSPAGALVFGDNIAGNASILSPSNLSLAQYLD